MTQLTNEDQKISDMAMNFEVRANLDAAQDALNRALKELSYLSSERNHANLYASLLRVKTGLDASRQEAHGLALKSVKIAQEAIKKAIQEVTEEEKK